MAFSVGTSEVLLKIVSLCPRSLGRFRWERWVCGIALLVYTGALGETKSPPTAEVAGCQSRLRAEPLGKALVDVPGIQAYLMPTTKKSDPKAVVAAASRKWTTEFLAAASLDLAQRVLSVCEDPKLSALLEALQTAYILRLGWSGPVGHADLLFRGLVSTGEEEKALRRAIGEKRNPPLSTLEPLAALAALHGGAKRVEGVLVVGSSPLPVDQITSVSRRACGGNKDCPLWDPVFIQRLTLLPGPGVATYIPEVGLMRLSRALVEDFKSLHQMVVLHELAHSASVRQSKRTGDDWVEAFARFSDWNRAEGGWSSPIRSVEGDWKDELVSESEGSVFSILPDPPMPAIGNDEQTIDGFVMARSERETRRSADPVEDYADHVAAYIVVPHRFCYRSKPIAPRKYEWIARELFGQERKLVCAPWP